jgi:phosphatidylserine/phosphatidylglycerophosphate/cardiolipin synthase-like enzyme
MTVTDLDFSPHSQSTLLQPGATCWRVSLASRATLLIDGDQYFKALRSALLAARRQILIAGWDFDSRIQLPRGPGEPLEGDDAAPEELGEFLGFLRRRRPELQIHVVRWDYHWWYSDDREASTRARLEHLGICFHDDASHPITGCVHHKIVTIDGALAFCGGIDLTHKRWDTCAHSPREWLRRDPDGEPYIPVHDTQLCVAGPVACDLAEYLLEHWPTADRPTLLADKRELWPRDVRVEFRDVRIGLARTLPAIGTRNCVREIETFYLRAIASTARELYMENQYFTSTRVATAIAERFRARPQLTGLLVGMDRPKTRAELHTMGYGRSAFCQVLRDAGVHDRVPLVAAKTDDMGINVHSKLAVFDDRWLTVGSANLNRRSMGFDVECNLILEATTAEHRAMIEKLRNGLLAEHLGMSLEQVAGALASHGLSNVAELSSSSRRLVRIDPESRPLEPNFGPILAPIFDPEGSPIVRARPTPVRSSRWIGSLLLVGLMAVLALTGSVVDNELTGLTALQQMLSSLLKG